MLSQSLEALRWEGPSGSPDADKDVYSYVSVKLRIEYGGKIHLLSSKFKICILANLREVLWLLWIRYMSGPKLRIHSFSRQRAKKTGEIKRV